MEAQLAYAVSPLLNYPTHERPACLEPLAAELEKEKPPKRKPRE